MTPNEVSEAKGKEVRVEECVRVRGIGKESKYYYIRKYKERRQGRQGSTNKKRGRRGGLTASRVYDWELR